MHDTKGHSLDCVVLILIYRKVIVVGSGYIAVELAGILNGLGSEVTLVIRYDKVNTYYVREHPSRWRGYQCSLP